MKLSFFIILIFCFIGCQTGPNRHHMALNDKNGIDTSFDIHTKELKISNNNKPYILFFFSTTCGACNEQIKILNDLQKEFKDVVIVGIMGNSLGLKQDLEILKQKDVRFMTITSNDSISYFSNVVGGVVGVPVTYVFDSSGKIYKKYLGITPNSVIRKDLKILL